MLVYGDDKLRKDHPVVAFLAREKRCASLGIYKAGCAPSNSAYSKNPQLGDSVDEEMTSLAISAHLRSLLAAWEAASGRVMRCVRSHACRLCTPLPK